MARYSPVWLEIARAQYDDLPAEIRELVDARLTQLLEEPKLARAAYDEPTDQWTTTYGAGSGLIVYAVVDEHRRIIILRLV